MKINQDDKHRLQSLSLFFLESFKVFMATLLVVFVPQKCDHQEDGNCSINDNFYDLDNYNIFCLVFNFITLFNFLTLYIIEKKREFWCIEYLDVDHSKPKINLITEIEDYPLYKFKLIQLNKLYQLMTKILLVIVFINIITSAILIFHYYYLDYRSITVFISNLLLIGDKLYNSYNISKKSIRELIAYSAYMKMPMVYNTIDSDHVINNIELNNPVNQFDNDIVDENINNEEKNNDEIISEQEIVMTENNI
jgi:hypothetical protein